MIIFLAVKEWGSGHCILGARSTEIKAMQLCVDHDANHPDYCIESMEVDGDYGISCHLYTAGTLQMELARRLSV